MLDLNELKESVTESIQENLENVIEIKLPEELKRDISTNILGLSFEGNTGKYTTTNGNLIYIPSPWLYVAAKLQTFLNELNRYKTIVDDIVENSGAIDSYLDWTEELKRGDANLSHNVESYLDEHYNEDKVFIKRFLIDYNWWGGGKAIGRSQGDFSHSALLKASGLLNESSGFIAHLAAELSGKSALIKSIIDLVEGSNEAVSKDKYIEDSELRAFVFKVLSYLSSSDENRFYSLINERESYQLNNKKLIRYDISGRLNGIIAKSEDKRSEADLKTSNTLRYFSEPLFESNSNFFYVSTQWSNTNGTGLTFNNFKSLIEEKFNNTHLHFKEEKYVFKIRFYPPNRILYGAPGTGKSYLLNQQSKDMESFRVTFHPELTYGQFVGAYKPISRDGKIDYDVVKGPFLNAYSKAIEVGPEEKVVLIIEELNRSNVSSVFGDIFQLLDRTNSGESEYSIQLSKEIENHLKNDGYDLSSGFKIPSNMFIWASMNSSDQGVFPLDTAFKRRWSMEYVGINNGDQFVTNRNMKINNQVSVNWNKFRKSLNSFLMGLKINEDKLIGPFFLTENELNSENGFKGKLILYLWDDIFRHKNRKSLFNVSSLSEIVETISTKEDTLSLFEGLFSSQFTEFISARNFFDQE